LSFSYINYLDEKSNSLRFFLLDEKEILHRINIEKGYGKIGELIKDELKKYGINNYLND